jgi:hypothetical protein
MKNKEKHSVWQEKFNGIRQSSEYKFVRQFTKKFRNQGSQEELLNLSL